MKISAKLLILTLALFIVTASVLYFLKAMTKPPTQMEDIDEFSQAIIMDIEDVTDTLTLEELDSTYVWILTELKKWNKNNYFNDVQYDYYVQQFFNNYVFSFSSVIKRKLSTEKWGVTEKKYILERVSAAQSEILIGQNIAVIDVNSELKTKMKKLLDICSDYEDACRLISYTNFENIDDAKRRVSKANMFANDVYISHSDINTKVSSFPDDIGNSHYDLVTALLKKMADWPYYTLSQTEANYSKFKKIVDDYKNAHIYGNRHPKSMNEFISQAKQYMQEAYDNKCLLTVNDYSGSYNTTTWTNSNGLYTYNIYTNHPDGYSVHNLPNWIRVKDKSKEKLSISYDDNNTGYSRVGYFSIVAGKKTLKVNCTQNAPQNVINITSINQYHNVFNNGKKGMNITVSFNAIGFQGKTLYVNVYFYNNNGNALKDYNGSYRTTDGYVATYQTYTPSSNNISTSITVFMPYDELHMAKGNYNLKFFSSITQGGKSWTSSTYQNFTFNQY